MSGRCGTPSCRLIDTNADFSFPKHLRILRSGDFGRVYAEGFRMSGPYFRAFCCSRLDTAGPRVGLTVPRSMGKAVVRNRVKRRMREALRQEIRELNRKWDVVFNPRQSVLDAPMDALRREVKRVFERCNAS